MLNGVGGRVLELIDEGLALPEIVERLEGAFDVPRERLVRDVSGFLPQLLEAEVVRRVGSAPDPRRSIG